MGCLARLLLASGHVSHAGLGRRRPADRGSQREISLIYYGTKQGLEDRVFRIRTERSSATSLPEPRTSHNISNVEILSQSGGELKVRFNWFNLSYRYKTTDSYFGTSFYTIDTSGDRWLITAKKVVLKNDYIHHVVDIYHI